MRPDLVSQHPYIDHFRDKGYQYLSVQRDMLLHAKEFGLTMEDVIVYARLFDFAKLSAKNNRADDNGNVYIFCTIEATSNYFSWSINKTRACYERLKDCGLLIAQKQQSKKNKMRTANKLFLKHWAPASVIYSVEQLKNGGFFPVTLENIGCGFSGNYYVLPLYLLEDERYAGLSLRAKLLYAIALDEMHLSLDYGKIDNNGRLWCTLDRNLLMPLLGCTNPSLVSTFKELENIGLMERVRNGIDPNKRIYLRDYMPSSTQTEPPNANNAGTYFQGANVQNQESNSPDKKIKGTQVKNLHYANNGYDSPVSPDWISPGKSPDDAWKPKSASGVKNPQSNHPSYPSSISILSQHNIAADAADASSEIEKGIYITAYRRQVEYMDLKNDILLHSPQNETILWFQILDQCIELMAEDTLSPARKLRFGKDTCDKDFVIDRYRIITRYIMYTLLSHITSRWDEVKNKSLYLRNSLLKAAEDHAGSAYYVEQRLKQF
jgi:hypothetical protein